MLLRSAELLILVLKVIPLQLLYCHTLLYILRHTTQAMAIQGIRMCSNILIHYVPWDIFRAICGGDTCEDKSHCLFKVFSGLESLLWNVLQEAPERHTRYQVLVSRWPVKRSGQHG